MFIDTLFEDTEKWLKQGIHAKGIEIDKLGGSRIDVVKKCLATIEQIEALVLNNEAPDDSYAKVDPQHLLIRISLHDMKTFNALLRIIVIFGIHPCLDQGVGIPYALRFKGQKIPVIQETQSSEDAHNQLLFILKKLTEIIQKGGDVADLILLGNYASDLLCGSMQLAFDPSFPAYNEPFAFIKHKIDTYTLIGCYTALLLRTAPKWFAAALSRELAMIPIHYPNGVRSLIEFTSGFREKEGISPTDLDKAVKILKAVPRGMSLTDYASTIGSQLLEVLSLDPSNPLVPATAYIIDNIYQQRQEIVTEGVQNLIVETLIPNPGSLSGDVQVEKCLFASSAILKGSHPVGLISQLCSSLLTRLWILFAFMVETHRPAQIIKGILVSFVNIAASDQDLESLSQALLGTTDVFAAGENGGVSIKGQEEEEQVIAPTLDPLVKLSRVDERVELFSGLVSQFSEPAVSKLFTIVLKRWIAADQSSLFKENDPFLSLADSKLLQKLSQSEKGKLMKSSSEIIQVICTLINEYVLQLEGLGRSAKSVFAIVVDPGNQDRDSDDEADSDDDEDEAAEQSERISICLNLIETFLSERDVLSDEDIKQLILIQSSVQYLAEHGTTQLQTYAVKVVELLRLAAIHLGGNENNSKSKSFEIYENALTSLGDPMIPIRAHGIYLLRTLVEAKDVVLGTSKVRILRLFLDQLKDNDSFIYLNSIKGIEAVVDVYGLSTDNPNDDILAVLLGYYIDSQVPLDERLRSGEAILRVVQKNAKVLKRAALGEIVDCLILVVSRRKTSSPGQDERLRMSAMSIMGLLCELNPLGLTPWLFDIVDCALGILTFETSEDLAVLRRASVVLIHSLASGVESLSQFPNSQMNLVKNRLQTTYENDTDALVREQALVTIELLQESIYP